MVQHGTVRYGMVHYSTVRHGTDRRKARQQERRVGEVPLAIYAEPYHISSLYVRLHMNISHCMLHYIRWSYSSHCIFQKT